MKTGLLDKCWRWNYPVFMLTSLLTAFFLRSSNDIIIPLFLLFWGVYGIVSFLKVETSQFKMLFTLLLVYVFLSIFSYAFNNVPFVAYYSDLRSVFISMLFVYVGMQYKDEDIYKIFVYSTLFCDISGLVLYFWQPDWYVGFKTDVYLDAWYAVGSNVNEENVMTNGLTSRFSSFFPNSYPIAFYNIFSLCIVFNDLYRAKEKRLIKSNYILMGIVAICIVAISLTLTRIAILYLGLLLLYFLYYGYHHKKKNRLLFLWMLIVIIGFIAIAIIYILQSGFGELIIEHFLGRFDSAAMTEAHEGSRSDQIAGVLEIWNNIIFGDGMGSRGGAVRKLGMAGLTDCNWVRILVEYGIVGSFLFISVIGITLKRASHFRRYLTTEMMIIMYVVLAMIVSDAFSKGHMILLFWFAVGRVWNKKYLYEKKINNISI